VGRPAVPMNVCCPLLSAVVHGSPFGCGPSTDRTGFRSRPVADASGAPVPPRPGTDRPAGHGKADPSGSHVPNPDRPAAVDMLA
jgi:hypothetical protein